MQSVRDCDSFEVIHVGARPAARSCHAGYFQNHLARAGRCRRGGFAAILPGLHLAKQTGQFGIEVGGRDSHFLKKDLSTDAFGAMQHAMMRGQRDKKSTAFSFPIGMRQSR
jgi:hypothetical protein